ncbi:MAG: DUF3305 domain-containing protein [Gammaproteobacteria bacterium]
MEHDNTTIPNRFQVAVILTRQPSRSRWVSHVWKARGVVMGTQEGLAQAAGQRVRSDPDGSEDYLWSGIPLHLYKDQVESYYHNLLAPQPALYVVLRTQQADGPQPGAPYPVLVSASYDEANAFVESDDDAQPVAMPSEIYPWVERFVLEHYAPERPVKRKRKNWKEDGRG